MSTRSYLFCSVMVSEKCTVVKYGQWFQWMSALTCGVRHVYICMLNQRSIPCAVLACFNEL